MHRTIDALRQHSLPSKWVISGRWRGEDISGGWTFDRLRSEGFSDHIIEALQSVTRRDGEDYEAFVQRSAANPIGRRVKLADLHDNSDLSRIAVPSARDFQRIEKYRRAIDLISQLPV